MKRHLPKILCGALCVSLIFVPLASHAYPLRGDMGRLYEFVATPSFAKEAKDFYLKSAALDARRTVLIAKAKDDCGARYEGTSVTLIELAHMFDSTRREVIGHGHSYAIPYETVARMRWLVVETLSCSSHEGHDQSVLNAVVLSGSETALVTYRYVHGWKQKGFFTGGREIRPPAPRDVKRSYKIDGPALADQFRAPYAEE